MLALKPATSLCFTFKGISLFYALFLQCVSLSLVGLCLRPVLCEVHSGPGRAAAGGCGADRAVGPESAHPRLVRLWLIQPSEQPAQTKPHSQALPMVHC